MSEATVALPESASGLFASAAAGMSAAGRAIPLSLMAALPGLVFFAGYDNLAYGLGLVAGCVLAGQLIAPRLAGQRATTVAEAIRVRFGTLAYVLAAAVIVLVVIPLLVAELTVIGTLAEGLLGLPYLAAVLGMLLIAAVAIFLPGERAFGWLAMAAYLLLAAALLLPLALMAIKAHGFVAPHLAQGQALMTIAVLEEKLLESGLVDFDTFSAHTTPFLRLTPLNFIALVVSLALGIAVLPHFVAALAARRNAAATRLAGAWTALFVMLLVITVPALAAYAKLEIYGAIAAGTKLSDLPLWLEAPSRAGLAHVHGTSVAMLEQLAAMPGIERTDLAAASDHLALHAITLAERWSALAPEAQQAVVAAARSLAAAPATTSAWALYVSGVLPAAAASAGNEAATLTQASLVLEPLGLLLALPALSGAPLVVAIVLAAGLLALGCVMMVSLTSSLFRLQGGAEPRWRRIAIALAALAVVGGIAALRPGEIVPIVIGSLSLSAAGLFPVLAAGLAWKRATAAGAVAAILVGAGVTLYYDIGVQVFPAAFYKTWSGLSDAGEYAIEEFDRLEEIWREAEAGDEKAAAASVLDDWARGTPTRPGLANWFGIDSAFGGALGAAAGLIALLLVSAATSRRRSTA